MSDKPAWQVSMERIAEREKEIQEMERAADYAETTLYGQILAADYRRRARAMREYDRKHGVT